MVVDDDQKGTKLENALCEAEFGSSAFTGSALSVAGLEQSAIAVFKLLRLAALNGVSAVVASPRHLRSRCSRALSVAILKTASWTPLWVPPSITVFLTIFSLALSDPDNLG